jgi:hypothetical protein
MRARLCRLARRQTTIRVRRTQEKKGRRVQMPTLSSPPTLLTGFGLHRTARRRAWALLLALALVLAAFMHVAHTHDADTPASYKFCSFCTTLDRGSAPPPVVTASVPRVAPDSIPVQRSIAAPASTAVRSPQQPRAPPPALQA